MLYVRDDDLQRAFTTMINKLIFAHDQILIPLDKELKLSSKDDNLEHISELHKLLLQNTEQRETLKKLMVQGYIDKVLFMKENNDLLTQADAYRTEILQHEKRMDGTSSRITEVTSLLEFAKRAPMLTSFDEELFKMHIDCIVVHSRKLIEFKLKCGLNLTERI